MNPPQSLSTCQARNSEWQPTIDSALCNFKKENVYVKTETEHDGNMMVKVGDTEICS